MRMILGALASCDIETNKILPETVHLAGADFHDNPPCEGVRGTASLCSFLGINRNNETSGNRFLSKGLQDISSSPGGGKRFCTDVGQNETRAKSK